MALTIPIGGGLIGLTARGLMAARKAAQVAKAAKAASKVDDPSQAAVARSLGVADDIAVGAPKPPLPPDKKMSTFYLLQMPFSILTPNFSFNLKVGATLSIC